MENTMKRFCGFIVLAVSLQIVVHAEVQEGPPQPKSEIMALAEEFALVDFAAMRAAIDHLIRVYPSWHKSGATFLEKISEYEAHQSDLNAKLKAGDKSVIRKSREMLDFRREVLVNRNPAIDFDQVLFTKRKTWLTPEEKKAQGRNANPIGLPANFLGNSHMPNKGTDSALLLLDIRKPSQAPVVVYKPEDGSFIGDIDLHFNAHKAIFSSSDSNKTWQVFEINMDGTGLRQVSTSKYRDLDNYDPMYLPDGRVIFCSTSGYHGVPCLNGVPPVGNLHIMNPDGTGVRRLTFEQDNDWYPSLTPGGRVIYTRWEYTDTPHYFTRVVMTMNPDGTGQVGHYGSNSYWPTALFYPQILPNKPNQFVGIVSGHHGVGRAGELYIFDVGKGRSHTNGVVRRIPSKGKSSMGRIADDLVRDSWPKFVHPHPITDKHFLVSCKPTKDSQWGLYYVDVFDNIVLLREEAGYALFEPIALKSRKTPPVIPDKVDLSIKTGRMMIQDVYTGPGLRGVPRGTVKSLRLFVYEYGYLWLAGDSIVGVDGPWDVHRILGTVPVYEDGSALFNVPANRPIAIQPLDSEGRALQLMRSWTVAMPGESVSCIGCHEYKNRAASSKTSIALTKPPSDITPWYGPARGFSFDKEIQPVLDRYCVGCHDGSPDKEDRPDLRGIREGEGKKQKPFTTSYYNLYSLVRKPGAESDYHLLVPLNFHTSTSELEQMLEKGHHNVKMDQESWSRIRTWIDLNAPALGAWTESTHFRVKQVSVKGGAVDKRREMRKLYAGLDIDVEALFDADYDRTFVKPEPEKKTAPPPKAPGWPFGRTEAAAMQGDAATQFLDLGSGEKITLKRIPAGEFVMGSNDETQWERPMSRVKIEKAFWMGDMEVSLKQYKLFNPEHLNRPYDLRSTDHFGNERSNDWKGDKLPVIRVSWNEAVAFCKWLSEKTGRKVTLPTEAQWEWACRAGTDTAMFFGGTDSDFSQYANVSDYSTWFISQGGSSPQKVSSRLKRKEGLSSFQQHPKAENYSDDNVVLAYVDDYKPNPWGLKNMHGNVMEWTLNNFRPYPYDPAQGAKDVSLKGRKVVRGGSWYDRPKRCTSSYRLAYSEWQKVFNVGFRIIVED